MFTHGTKVESDVLRRRMIASERGLAEAAELAARLQRRVEHAERALLAATRTIPEDTSTRLYLPAAPWANSTMLGTAVVTDRTSSRNVLLSDPDQSVGMEELLVPGAFWSGLSETASATFEASIQPAYTMLYNEVLLPYIGGIEQTVMLHSAGGPLIYSGVRTTRVMRFEQPREWNGRITVHSQAAYKIGSMYVHAGVAPAIFQTSWLSSGTIRGEKAFSLGASKQLTVLRVWAMPSGIQLNDATFSVDGTPFTGSTTVSDGSVLRVEAPIGALTAASYLALDILLV